MPALSVAFHTLGCKLNQLETESIAEAFRTAGFKTVPWGDRADIHIVNTCTVTSKAEQKARRVIRKALKEDPSACVVATGCYAQLDPASVAAIASALDGAAGGENPGAAADRRRLLVVSGDDKSALLDLPRFLADAVCSSAELPSVLDEWSALKSGRRSDPDRFRFDANDFAFHSRASLKIQDGCDNACSYCRVRLARGRSVSLDADEALRRLRELEERGYGEAVLTGINVSQYRGGNPDAGDPLDFPGLLRFLLAGTRRISLRISSTEPDAVTPDFADAVSDPRVRPHFHLSVQSLCDATLGRMRRRYAASRVEFAVAQLRAAKDDPFLACDVIAGFPGETDAEFEETYGRLGLLGFAWIHAFPFSPRPGTEAVSLPGHVREGLTMERVERLLALGRAAHAAYAGRWTGREVLAIAEAAPQPKGGSACVALSENYLRLSIPLEPEANAPRPGSTLRCRIGAPLRSRPGSDADDGDADAAAELLEVLRP